MQELIVDHNMGRHTEKFCGNPVIISKVIQDLFRVECHYHIKVNSPTHLIYSVLGSVFAIEQPLPLKVSMFFQRFSWAALRVIHNGDQLLHIVPETWPPSQNLISPRAQINVISSSGIATNDFCLKSASLRTEK